MGPQDARNDGRPAARRAHQRDGTGIADVLRIPAARRLQLADLVSGTGDALYWIALVAVLLGTDPSGALVAVAVIARLAPRLLLGPIAGVAVDRFDRASLMMALDASRAVLMVVLAIVVTIDAHAAAIIVIVFVVGALGTPYRPAASARMAGSVGERLLAPANAMSVSAAQAVGLIGPVLAAAMLAIAAPPWAFIANALTFAAAVVLVGATRRSGRTAVTLKPPGGAGWTAALRSGLATVRHHDGLAVVLALAATLAVVRGAEMVLYVQVAEESLGLGPGGYGLVAGAMGAGALVALPIAGRTGRATAAPGFLVGAAVLSAAPLVVLADVRGVVPALAVVVVQGAATTVFEVLALTTVQRLSPPTSIGRVLGLHTTTSGGTKLAGSLLAPAAVAAIGLRGGLVAIGALALVGVAALAAGVLSLGRRLRQRRAELAPTVERLADLGIFAWASMPSIERLAMRLTVVHPPAGTTILREGAPPDDLYVVVSGELVVDARGHEINRLGPGDWFGEIGLLRNIARTATVTTATDAVLWRIPGDELVTALTAGVTLPDDLVDDMQIRIARSDAVDG